MHKLLKQIAVLSYSISLPLFFLSLGCDISVFNTLTLQNPKLFISHVTLDWLPYLAQYSMNVTGQLVDESTVWGRDALENASITMRRCLPDLCVSMGDILCPL